MKKTLSLLAAAALVVSLAACSSSTSASGCTPTPSGASSGKVTVTGKFGTAPTVKFPKGLTAKTTERSVIIPGSGAVAKKNGTVDADYTIYDATSGKKLSVTKYAAGSASPFTLKTPLLTGMIKGLTCSPAGSRVVAVVPPADGFGTAGSTSLGVQPKDTLLFVFDVTKVSAPVKALTKANGVPQKPVAGMPTVTLAASGAPTITIPATAPPATTQIAELKKGTGTTVKDGDTVTANYTGVDWQTGKVFDSSWTNGAPITTPTSGVIPGFTKALVGQKVGSQVLVVIAPADGYGPSGGQPSAGIAATDTIVFVIDILGTTS
ncbi:MAG: peptidylprolyl isomerase [Microbacteriaceae bacterium]|nr:peptidylprolyl isomerase [Microbacteriaceae bacterium]